MAPKTITAGAMTFGYLEAGTGPLVLCLHGFPDTPHTFDDLLPRLARAGYHAVAPYMRGYAPTSIPADGDYSELRIGEDAIALIEAFGERDAVLVGHDWGALAAYTATSLAPERVRKLVTVAIPHPTATKPDLGFIRHLWHFFALPLPGTEAVLRLDDLARVEWFYRQWSPSYRPTHAELEPVKVNFRQRGRLEAALGYYRSLLRVQTTGYFTADARRIRALRATKTAVPTLSLHGSNDGASDPAAWRRTSGGYSGPYEEIEVQGVGHFLHNEVPERFATEVLRFLGTAPR
jgi:pimeloyl-ACP methyl ester carboxylesterase